jgi:succinyl-CoA synthetase beta subunit
MHEVSDGARGFYLTIFTDGTSRLPVMMAGEPMGMEIEEVTQSGPDKVFKSYIDSAIVSRPWQDRKLAYEM